MKNLKKYFLVLLMIIGGVFVGTSTTTMAAIGLTGVRLEADNKTVTTFYPDCKGSTIVYVIGYEKNTSTGAYKYYNKQKSTTDTGAVKFTHKSTSGYEFQLYAKGVQLKGSVVVNGKTVYTEVATY